MIFIVNFHFSETNLNVEQFLKFNLVKKAAQRKPFYQMAKFKFANNHYFF